MKKIFCLHISIIIFIFLVSSCNSNSGYYLIAGEFYSDENLCDSNCEDYNADFQSAKLTVKEIDKETYLSANGINVVKDVSSDRVGDYYLIELLVFSKEKEDYKKYGEDNFQCFELETNLTFENRNKECFYMDKYKTCNSKYGYNTRDNHSRAKGTIEIIKGLPESNQTK